jgi:hypothetical protein
MAMKRTKVGFLVVSSLLVAGLWFGQSSMEGSKTRKFGEAVEQSPLLKSRSELGENSTAKGDGKDKKDKENKEDKNSTNYPIKFSKFLSVHSKALKTSEERRSLHAMLSDPELIEQSFEVLSARSEKGFDLSAQEKRMRRVEFLAEALSDRDNPVRGRILEGVQTILSREIPSMEVDPVEKRSLAGDQIELFQILQNAEPSMARAIEARAMGTANEKLIAYAIKNQERI